MDLVGGTNDLKNGIIRTVGNPVDRFNEDRLRIMRAIRFAARFGSNLDSTTDQALETDSSLKGISSERIRDEFIKSIKFAKSVVYLLNLYKKYNLFKWIFGALEVDFSIFIEEYDPIVLIACLLRKNNVDLVKKELNHLSYSTEEVSKIAFLLKMLSFKPEMILKYKKAEINSKITSSELIEFSRLNNLDMNLIKKFIGFKLTVTGDDMLKQGIKPGPEMGKTIEQAEFDNFIEFI